MARRLREAKVETVIVVYWQGQRRQPNMLVRPDSGHDPERGGPVLRIKKPDNISNNPLSLLSMTGDNPTMPDEAVEQLALAIGHLWGCSLELGQGVSLAQDHPIRVLEEVELTETAEERKERITGKKVRKAFNKLKQTGLRMGAPLKQLRHKIEGLKAVEGNLNEKQLRVLRALEAEASAREETLAAMRGLNNTRSDT